MMSSAPGWKPYPAYRDSGVEWLGKVPEGWDVLFLKRILVQIKDGTHGTYQRTNNGYPLLSAKNVFYDGIKIEVDESLISENDFKNIVQNGFPKKNDILLTIVGTIGRCYVYDREEPLAFQRSVAFLRFNQNIIPKYYYFYFQAREFLEQLKSFAKTSAQSGVYMNDVVETTVLKPSTEEQRAIARFLDDRTQKLDTLIEKKQKLIELLKEERIAIINQAVTKGLNPDVLMKDSGIEWLGEIPRHWKVKKLKYMVKGKLEYGANESAELEDTNLPRYIRITDFGDDGELRNDTFKSLLFEIAKDYLLQKGDILFARSGATVGKTFQFKNYQGLACFAGYLIKASPDENKVLSDFLYLFTKSKAYENWKKINCICLADSLFLVLLLKT